MTIIKLVEIKNTKPRRDHGDISGLKESIRRLGLLQPLVVTPDYSLVAGRRRYQALVELGIEEVPVYVVNPKDNYLKFLMALDENLKRKDLSWQEIARCELEEKRIYEECYPETKHGTKGAKARWDASAESAPAYTQAKAQALGVSERKIQEEIQLAEALEQYSELEHKKKKSTALKYLRQQERLKKLEEKPLPKGKFNVIVADPSWPYQKRTEDENHRARSPYSSMTLEEIEAFAVPAADDCVLWLWTTNAFIHEAYHVLEAWGFQAKTILTWVKPKFGLGDWLRGQTEHCLMAVKGHPVVRLSNQSTVLVAKGREHSRKPEAFYHLVETLCPGSKLELFARIEREGWVAHGQEIGYFSQTD